mmetsp:Transcript_14415/g.20635  ORF Transcript_14415/g.20635 Transcript_14415/m.20635 type:complete len:622 (+) Transcript_14415:212-2077(+)|eukprot:CAMPEP_0172420516 /NCGR_PEP_ID=MMETSP1064-20121228/6881_1 /TAXON_ID=202472 /ORGANISM="Aulacoseira subarctica , Strain CCAP 1002/5" /LENGTH=621 /DNA_ID=CAMNT_0013160519 /DNA_START=140 /DNA_END=2005 /DNA_ORIENTATION=-
MSVADMTGTKKSSSSSKDAKLKRRTEEAARLGISVEDLKKQQKKEAKSAERRHKASREAELLNKEAHDESHEQEEKRMRSWSFENNNKRKQQEENDDEQESSNKRRRTRSMDVAEEKKKLPLLLTPDEWRAEHAITVRKLSDRSYAPPPPYQKFSDAPFLPAIQKALTSAGFDAPTAIQAQAWPIAIAGSDMISIAKTGSGKTCGYLLPSLQNYMNENPNAATRNHSTYGSTAGGRGAGGRFGSAGRGGGGYANTSLPFLLVLAPTRELACQILVETQKFCRDLHLRSVCCYGGSPKGPQIGAIERGVDCIIATPGRLNDLLEMGKISLREIKFVVLDEADRMLDMGFEPQIRSVMSHVPEKRQTLLFSATWPKEIQKLAYDFLKDPVQVNVGDVDSLNANKDITQNILMISEMEKYDKLVDILKELTGGEVSQHHTKLIVFVAKKVTCDELANRLWENGFAVDSLHGDRAQWERTKVIAAFKTGNLRVLIATDVAARGLDVKDVGVVINYDMPAGTNGVEDYVHRIGRTGRAGQKGIAYTFFTNQDSKCARQLVEVLESSGQVVPDGLKALSRPRFSSGWGGGGGGRGGRYGRGGGRGYSSSARGGRGRFFGGRSGRGGY